MLANDAHNACDHDVKTAVDSADTAVCMRLDIT